MTAVALIGHVSMRCQDVSGDGDRVGAAWLGERCERESGGRRTGVRRHFAVMDTIPGRTLVRVTLHEGRNRIVRQLAAASFQWALVRTDIGAWCHWKATPGQRSDLAVERDQAKLQAVTCESLAQR